MKRLVIFLTLGGLLLAAPLLADVELSRQGAPVQRLSEVYLYDGVPYLAIDDVLPALKLSGYWNSIDHRYYLRLPSGTATFFPGSRYLQLGERFIPLTHSARFIDGRLRVAESFVVDQLGDLLPFPLYYRNLDPPHAVTSDQNLFGRLFSFLLQKKRSRAEPSLRAVAIDPAHGGEDAGVLGLNGSKEKDVTLGVARQLEKLIKMQLGVPVFLSRNEDYQLDADKRLEVVAQDGVDAFLLLHAQGALTPRSHGLHLYVRPEAVEKVLSPQGEDAAASHSSMMLALRLSAALRDAGFDVAEVSQTALLPLERGNLPTVLIELGYLTAQEDWSLLTQKEGQKRLAQALLNGLKDFAEQTGL
ncbi:MAG: N-acetylmuramoyl-L-alanine amidase [Desulfuromonadaceae bacterium]|nr:N-acetylmuramoyl-L-alanine amidase [Desulfuromonadaceae bacterium]